MQKEGKKRKNVAKINEYTGKERKKKESRRRYREKTNEAEKRRK